MKLIASKATTHRFIFDWIVIFQSQFVYIAKISALFCVVRFLVLVLLLQYWPDSMLFETNVLCPFCPVSHNLYMPILAGKVALYLEVGKSRARGQRGQLTPWLLKILIWKYNKKWIFGFEGSIFGRFEISDPPYFWYSRGPCLISVHAHLMYTRSVPHSNFRKMLLKRVAVLCIST